MLAAVLRAGAVIAAASAPGAILVVMAAVITAMFRAGAVVAATGTPGAVVVTAAFGAERAVVGFAADQPVTTVELW